jgi:hypothetical protein
MNEKCVKGVNRGDGRWSRYSPCGRNASVERDGKHYCKMHDPVARREKWDAKMEALNKKWDAQRDEANWKQAACAVCSGVDRQTLERLGSGWLAKQMPVLEKMMMGEK